jgi:hypothetical protein
VSRTIVLTTVNDPTAALTKLAELFADAWEILVVGDSKTKRDWRLTGVEFIGFNDQRRLPFLLAPLLPEGNYSRKNLGYLLSIQRGADQIAELDDDNYPVDWKIGEASAMVRAEHVRAGAWFNALSLFTRERVWPRGFPLELLRDETADPGGQSAPPYPIVSVLCPVQQFVSDGDPDVDAVYRVAVGKTDHRFSQRVASFAQGTMTPFNSQCTLWFPEAYVYLYLPSFAEGRMFDIWRSYVTQVCLWAHDMHLAYRGPGVIQRRTGHHLLDDLADELFGYRRNLEITALLRGLSLSSTRADAGANLMTCYQALVDLGVLPSEELTLVRAWLRDVESMLPLSKIPTKYCR